MFRDFSFRKKFHISRSSSIFRSYFSFFGIILLDFISRNIPRKFYFRLLLSMRQRELFAINNYRSIQIFITYAPETSFMRSLKDRINFT